MNNPQMSENNVALENLYNLLISGKVTAVCNRYPSFQSNIILPSSCFLVILLRDQRHSYQINIFQDFIF